jgi:hypothetical protein
LIACSFRTSYCTFKGTTNESIQQAFLEDIDNLWKSQQAADQQKNPGMIPEGVMNRFCLLNPLVVRRVAPNSQ